MRRRHHFYSFVGTHSCTRSQKSSPCLWDSPLPRHSGTCGRCSCGLRDLPTLSRPRVTFRCSGEILNAPLRFEVLFCFVDTFLLCSDLRLRLEAFTTISPSLSLSCRDHVSLRLCSPCPLRFHLGVKECFDVAVTSPLPSGGSLTPPVATRSSTDTAAIWYILWSEFCAGSRFMCWVLIFRRSCFVF